ncbi:MAG: hypothetical protein ACKOB1_04925 [Planctomycetia bacterium]
MHRVTVTGSMEQELLQTSTVAEICDASGRVIGHFRPCHVPPHLLEPGDVPLEQLLERGQLRNGRPFSQVISDCEGAANRSRG